MGSTQGLLPLKPGINPPANISYKNKAKEKRTKLYTRNLQGLFRNVQMQGARSIGSEAYFFRTPQRLKAEAQHSI
jgi:hypothetical protein